MACSSLDCNHVVHFRCGKDVDVSCTGKGGRSAQLTGVSYLHVKNKIMQYAWSNQFHLIHGILKHHNV